MATPAGWYDGGNGRLRYWDGRAWTEHVYDPQTGVQSRLTPARAEQVVPGSASHALFDPRMNVATQTQRPPKRRTWPWVLGGVGAVAIVAIAATVAVILLTPTPPPPPQAAPTPSRPSETAKTERPPVELSLSVGGLVPMTGVLAGFGEGMEAGLTQAVDDINAADTGLVVDLETRDSGDVTNAVIAQSFVELAARAQVLVGPVSSSTLALVSDSIDASAVPIISPGATSSVWNERDAGYLFRVAPSDTLQGVALAQALHNDGRMSTAVFQLDDESYAAPLGESLTVALAEYGIDVVYASTHSAEAEGQAAADVSAAITAGAQSVVFVGFDEAGAYVDALSAQGFDLSQAYFSDGAWVGTDFEPAATQISVAKTPVSFSGSDRNYAAESYDAVILAALAAYQARSTDPDEIRDNLVSVSRDGKKCTSFSECAALIDSGDDIDYDGVSGEIEFTGNGDVSSAQFGRYHFTGAASTFVANLTVSAG